MRLVKDKLSQFGEHFVVAFSGCLILCSFTVTALKSIDRIAQVCSSDRDRINTLIVSDAVTIYDSIFQPVTATSSSAYPSREWCSILFQAIDNDSIFLVHLSQSVDIRDETTSPRDLKTCANIHIISHVSSQTPQSESESSLVTGINVETFYTSGPCLVLNITIPRFDNVHGTYKEKGNGHRDKHERGFKPLIVVTSLSRASYVCNLLTHAHCLNNDCILASLFCNGVPNCVNGEDELMCDLHTFQPTLYNPSTFSDSNHSANDANVTSTGELILWLALFGIVMGAILVILWVHYRSGSVISRTRGYTRSRADTSFSFKLRLESFANKMGIIGLGILSLTTQLVAAAANFTSATTNERPAEQSTIGMVSSASGSLRPSPTISLVDRLGADATTASYTNRLDFISVIVICSIFALCFIVCIVIGCRRRKRRPPPEELITSQAYSDTESRNVEVRNAGQVDRNVNSSGRQVESPPPTYSVIERQTSFTSYVSQTSSQFEIPPEYDEDWVPGDPAHASVRRSQRPGSRNSRASSRNNEPSSAQSVSVATNGANSSSRPSRSESARARGPPKVRPFRTGSETGRQRRQRTSTRPTTVSEDDGFSQSDELPSDASAGIPPRESESLSPDESVHVLVQVEAPPPLHLPQTRASSSAHTAAPRNGSRTDSASHNS